MKKNTIAIINKNQMYAYGDAAYAMYEKAPEQIQVSFSDYLWCYCRF